MSFAFFPEYKPHPFPFYKEIPLRPRRLLKVGNVDAWPSPRKHRKNALAVGCKDIRMMLKALSEAQERRDIDFLIIKVEDLFIAPIWEMLRELLSKQDRAWSIKLRCQFFTSEFHIGGWPRVEATLFKALSILQYVRFLDLSNDPHEAAAARGLLLILKHLPPFKCLEMLYIENISWIFDLAPILDLPFVHKISGLDISSARIWEVANKSNASSHALQQLREKCVEITSYRECVDSSMLDMLATALPSLQRFDVTFPLGYNAEEYEQNIENVVDWLASPKCKVAELRVYAYNPEDLSRIWYTVSEMQTLRSLVVDYDGEIDITDCIEALEECPNLNFLSLKSVSLSKFAENELLEFQLESRPRMLEIRVMTRPSEGQAFSDQIHFNSMVYQSVKKIQCSKSKGSFPLSAWPIALQKICDIPTNMVTIEETFKLVRDVLSEPHKLKSSEAPSAPPCICEGTCCTSSASTSNESRKRRRTHSF